MSLPTTMTSRKAALLVAVLTALIGVLMLAAPASATIVAQVQVNPTSSGMPGANLATNLLNWVDQIALWGSLASLLIGAAVWGISQHAGNGYQAGRGRTFAIAGAVGALLAGLSPTIVNTLFNSAN